MKTITNIAYVVLALLALGCFALAPFAQAVVPPPDGGYAGENTAEGTDALFSLTTGVSNTALGFHALFSSTTGNDNTATGFGALRSNTTGGGNTANGSEALFSNTTGDFNTANGQRALFSNTEGSSNTANGALALLQNTTGFGNTATGAQALFSNTTGGANTATGTTALSSNTAGNGNTATGDGALRSNKTGGNNTATGGGALESNGSGSLNTANGVVALRNNTTGVDNTANGFQALYNNSTGKFNTADGVNALFNNTTGNRNIALGISAGQNLTTGSNNIDIGNLGVAGESNTIRIGTSGTQTAIYLAGILGKTVPMSTPVFINADGLLGTTTSSARFKQNIKPMDKASEAIHALKPVTFRYKREMDPDGVPQFGLVAEDVEKVNPDLVARDADGKPYTVRYEAVNAMLLNEFLKEHRKVQQLEKDVLSKIAQQQKQIETLTEGLQKVSTQLELNKTAPQIAVSGGR